jgi:hypothetical protein
VPVAASPTIVPLVLVAVAVVAVGLTLLVLLARHRGPAPEDVAVAYELAWDRLDFATVWDLSSAGLRDGRSKARFVADKRGAYAAEGTLRDLVRVVRPERVEVHGPTARVLTRLELRTGESVTDEVLLERDGDAWRVTGYRLSGRPRTGPAGNGTPRP